MQASINNAHFCHHENIEIYVFNFELKFMSLTFDEFPLMDFKRKKLLILLW